MSRHHHSSPVPEFWKLRRASVAARIMSAASVLALVSSGCVDTALEPESEMLTVAGSESHLDGHCEGDLLGIFRPECTSVWDPNATDHTLALNAAFAAARNYQEQNGGTAAHVELKARTYLFSDILNPGDGPIYYDPPGIIVRNENHQQNQTFLVTDNPNAYVTIQGGDYFQYLMIMGPYRDAGPLHGTQWQGTVPDVCGGTSRGTDGVNGSHRDGWYLFSSVVQGFDGYGVMMSATRDAKISHSNIHNNGLAGVYIDWYAAGNTIRGNLIRFNGANGIDITGDSTWVYQNNFSYNGWNLGACNYPYDRNGILVWGISDTPDAAVGNIIEDNDSFENDLHGIWVGGTGNGNSQVIDNVVKNNSSFYNGQDGILVEAQGGGSNTGTRVENNTIYGNAGWGLRFRRHDTSSQLSGAVATYNDITSSGSGCVDWGTGQVSHHSNKCNGTIIDPLSPLSVSISGPTDVQPYQASCTWSAVVSGGQGPYSYQWEKDAQIVGYASTYSSSVSSNGFALQVTVTDSQSGYDIAQIYVNPTYWGDTCGF